MAKRRMGQEQSGLVSAEQRIENIRKMDSRMEKRFGRETSNKVVVVLRYATCPNASAIASCDDTPNPFSLPPTPTQPVHQSVPLGPPPCSTVVPLVQPYYVLLGPRTCSGEHGTGKSALLKRLQGAPVSEVASTSPSEHGTIAKVPIQWRFQGDHFELEVKDVTDQGRSPRSDVISRA